MQQNRDSLLQYVTDALLSLMMSEFEMLSKKFAVIFGKFGIAKNDIVYFNVCDENLIPVALGGLWILGAIGSFGTKYKAGESGNVV